MTDILELANSQERYGDFHKLIPRFQNNLEELEAALFAFQVSGCVITCAFPPNAKRTNVFCRLYCVDAKVGVEYAIFHVWIENLDICLHKIEGHGLFLCAQIYTAFKHQFCGTSLRRVMRYPEPPATPTSKLNESMVDHAWSMASSHYADVAEEGFRALIDCAVRKGTRAKVAAHAHYIEKLAHKCSGELQRLTLLALYHTGQVIPNTIVCRCEESEYTRLAGYAIHVPILRDVAMVACQV